MSNQEIIPFLPSIQSSNNEKRSKTARFSINENSDILVEILKRLDGRTLGVAACVCRLWCDLATTDDSIWEHICFRHVSPPGVRALVRALGGYKHLFTVCVRPVLSNASQVGSIRVGYEDELTRQEAQLLLSLFCVDYYEKLGGGPGSIVGSDTTSSSTSSSLLFLCKPVNV